MEKLTKKEMIEELVKINKNLNPNTLIKLTWDKLDTKLAALKIVNQKNEEKKMTEKLEMTEGFVVGARDAKLSIGSLKKAKPAQEAVEAVKGVKGVEAVEAVKANKKEGIEAVKAVKAVEEVKAVKAVEAAPAKLPVQQVHLDSNSEEIMREVRARMADQGFADKFEGQIIEHNGMFRLTFEAETDKPIRAAFKACKAKTGYNEAGLKTLADAAKADAKAKKEAEKKAADAEEKDAPKDEPKTKDEEPKEEGEWPGSFEEE